MSNYVSNYQNHKYDDDSESSQSSARIMNLTACNVNDEERDVYVILKCYAAFLDLFLYSDYLVF